MKSSNSSITLLRSSRGIYTKQVIRGAIGFSAAMILLFALVVIGI
jgi:hypothetical protein